MSDQIPTAAPPPGQPEVVASLPSEASSERTRKTAIIAIGAVVAVLLLSCCVSVGLFAYVSLRSDAPPAVFEEPRPDFGEITEDLPADEGDRLREWIDWSPDSPELMPSPPPSKRAQIDKALAVVAPGFVYEDAVWEDAEYDEASDSYYSDAAYVRATHESSDRVSAAVELWIQSDEMVAEEIGFDLDEGDLLATIEDGGRELVYWEQWGEGFVLETEEDVALWQQLGEDWPDCVVVNSVKDAAGAGTFDVELTKWDLYAVWTDYPYVYATYAQVNGGWTLTDWEYVAADYDEPLILS
ncbi:MAG: hypothetical protein EG823_01965 [Actinobacteria bacterium]|nr:hypothetical protein [Actinomycetota bacterium]